MGGAIRMVIRDKDGSVWSNQRWTNAMAGLTRDVRFMEDRDDWFDRYKGNDDWHTDDHTLAPIEYGIVVVDRMTMTVIDCNAHSSALRLGIVNLVTDYDDPEYLTLIGRGLLRYRGKTFTVPDGTTLEEHTQALWLEDKHGVLEIDCAPWTYERLRNVGHDEVRLRMKALGFAFTARDEAAFDAYVAEYDRDEQIDAVGLLAAIPKTQADLDRDATSGRRTGKEST